jgi:hypothetical protein
MRTSSDAAQCALRAEQAERSARGLPRAARGTDRAMSTPADHIAQLAREACAIASYTLGDGDIARRDDATRVVMRLVEQIAHGVDAPSRTMWGDAYRARRGRRDA